VTKAFQLEYAWRKSFRSVGHGDCIEIAIADSCLLVRDSKDRNGPVLAVRDDSWMSLIESIKQADLPGTLVK
jgi:hypothetical protein